MDAGDPLTGEMQELEIVDQRESRPDIRLVALAPAVAL